MRLLHCTHSLDPASGGTAEFIKQESKLQAEAGNVCEVLCLDAPDAPWIGDFPARVHAVGPAALKYGWSPRFVPWLRQQRRNYDLVIVDGIWQFASFGTWLALNRTDTPYVVFPHGMLDPWFNERYPLKRLKKQLYWPLAEYHVLKDARAVLFTAEDERVGAGKSFRPYHCRELVVGLGTAPPPGEAAVQEREFFAAVPQAEGKRFFLFLGRLHEKKGCDLLLEAFADIARDHGDVVLIMAGPSQGPYGETLRRDFESRHPYSRDRVVWPGPLFGNLKWGALWAAEALVLPSHQENFGIVVAEALACGTPALISTRVNIWREVTDYGAGFADSDDLEGTKRLLGRWMELPAAERESMGENAVRCFQSRFHIGKFSAGYLKALQECARCQ